MRIIAGKMRSLPLKTPKGLNTRPTQDRIKETLFNIISPYLRGAYFLDLFSGSGGIGLEAISRGAEYAAFVEQDREAIQCIESNIAFTKANDSTCLYKGNVLSILPNMDKKITFDIVFMDPPYGNDLEKKVLELLKTSTIIDENTLIIVEADIDTDFSYVEEIGYTITRIKKYKTNEHVFIQRRS